MDISVLAMIFETDKGKFDFKTSSRIIKDFLAVTDENISTPRNLPIKSEFLKKMFNIVSKSIKPSKDEVSSNPRSRSAKLNILEKANEDYV